MSDQNIQNLPAGVHRITCAALLWFLGLGLYAAAPDDQQKLTSANVGFAFKLLKQVAQRQPGTNVFISPFSVSSVLQMVGNGAAGKTKTEMQAAFGTTGLSPDALNRANGEIGRALNRRSSNVVLTAANAIWYRKGTSVNPDFIACNERFFGATVDGLDFDDPGSAKIVNRWASDKTYRRITAIADGPFDPATRLFLANAVYFKGKWETPFDLRSTKDRVFHLREGRPKKVPMMEQTRRFDYRRGTGYQAVRLEYQGSSLGMYVFLPDTGSSPEKLIGIMSADTWQRVTVPGFQRREGTVVLPRFKLEYSVDLVRSLRSLGINAAFGDADFSGISSQPLSISAVRQRTFVEVNEEGTEAAAVTGMVVPLSVIEMNPPKPFQMIVDRPFLFLIEDQETRTILFAGILFDPAQSP